MLEAPRPLQPVREAFLRALVAFDARAARAVVQAAARDGAGVDSLYLEVLTPALHEIGERWERGEVSVAQEHLATALTASVLAELAPALRVASMPRRRAVVTVTSGEEHRVGGRMVADFLQAAGWEVDFLADRTPAGVVADFCERRGTHVVAISTALPWLLGETRRACAELKSLTSPPFVVVGGGAFAGVADPARHVGADAFAPDPRDLLALLRERSA